MSLWVFLLIRCSTFTLLSDVGHISHTCTQQHSPSSVSPSIHHAPFKGKLLLACIAVAGFSATDRLASVVLFVERSSDTRVESLGVAMGTAHIEATQTTSKRDATLLPKTLRQWVYPHRGYTNYKQERHHTIT